VRALVEVVAVAKYPAAIVLRETAARLRELRMIPSSSSYAMSPAAIVRRACR
jgi:hypothetical protein